MRLTRRQLRSLIKEFKSPDQIKAPEVDIPGILSGDGFPPIDDDDDREGPENKCPSFQEIHEHISYLYGTLFEFFINKNIKEYQHLEIYEVTDIPFELAIKDHGVYIAKELVQKCGRYNSNILKIIKNPRVLLGDDPEMSILQNFSVPGIERHELIYTIQVLRHSILRLGR